MTILRRETNGIEFFTVTATGESGMSQSGLARMCGVTQKAVDNLLDRLGTSTCPNFLKPLQGKDLRLSTSVHEYHNVTIIKDSVCAIILEWYAFESQRPTEKARQAFRQFAAIGIRTWIQSLTGWQNQTPEPITPTDKPQDSHPPVINQSAIANLLATTQNLQTQIEVALKHRHAIHNLVEKPTVVDLSLNRIIHTAVHEQAIKLNQALTTISQLQQQAQNLERQSIQEQIQESQPASKPEQPPQKNIAILDADSDLQQALEPRITKITTILMQFQVRKGGDRAIDTCTKKATIYALYEIGHSLKEISALLQMPYETVKTYVKLTRNNIRNYFSEQN